MENEKNFEIVEHLGVIGESAGGTRTTEVNRIKWGNRDAKFDIRDFLNKDGEKTPTKRGRTFSENEMAELYKVLEIKFRGA